MSKRRVLEAALCAMGAEQLCCCHTESAALFQKFTANYNWHNSRLLWHRYDHYYCYLCKTM